MLGPNNISDSPITIVILSLIVIIVPHRSPHCYFCSLILLLFGRLWLYCDPLDSYI